MAITIFRLPLQTWVDPHPATLNQPRPHACIKSDTLVPRVEPRSPGSTHIAQEQT
jgi:hypothetical protein